jgi:hypothetical protein
VVVATTGTPHDADAAGTWLAARGLAHVDAGVQTAPDDLGGPRATLLYSGDEEAFCSHRSTLELLGPALWLGPDPRAAATWDQALFGLWYDAQVGLLRALGSVAGAGVSADSFAEAAARQLGHVVEGVGATAREVSDASYPRGPATVHEHLPVVRSLVEARRGSPLGDGGLSALERRLAALSSAGAGDLGLTAALDPGLPA